MADFLQPGPAEVLGSLGTDYFLIDESLTPEERAVRDRVRAFCDREVIPIIDDYVERAEVPFELIPKLGALGVVGGTIEGYGCPGLSHVAAGLAAMELARGDGSVSTIFGVHSGLAMSSIAMLGSEEQKRRWLPAMARMEKLGAFALTEPDHGSDVVSLGTRARREGGEYVLEGKKHWIGNASIADLLIVWARDDEGNVGGFLVEKGASGLSTEVIPRKTTKRAVWQADVRLDGVRVPLESRLEGSRSFKDTARVLTATRYGVAWAAVGHAVAAYEAALQYVTRREQFGRPLAGFQMIQYKLARMLAEVTSMQLVSLQLSRLAAAGKLTVERAALAKLNNAAKARWVVSEAREMLGGNGVLLDYAVARHWMDMEAVYTYEGTDTVQALIVGRDVTGLQAFA